MNWLTATPLRWAAAIAVLFPALYLALTWADRSDPNWPTAAVMFVAGGLVGWLAWHHVNQGERGQS